MRWDPVYQQYANGRILGYIVYYGYYEYPSRRFSSETFNTSSADVYMVILRYLLAPKRYRISVAAFTSKGVGPQTSWEYITTGNISLKHEIEPYLLAYLRFFVADGIVRVEAKFERRSLDERNIPCQKLGLLRGTMSAIFV